MFMTAASRRTRPVVNCRAFSSSRLAGVGRNTLSPGVHRPRLLDAFFSLSGWSKFVVLSAALSFSLALWIFGELVDHAVKGDYLPQEERILKAFRHPDNLTQPIGPHWVEVAARDLTAMGGATFLSLLTVSVLTFELLSGRKRTALLLLVAALGGLALSTGLKELFDRPRPTAVPALMVETSASFPSGHTMLSSVIYLTLGSLVSRALERRSAKLFVVGLALLLACLTGISRVFLGVHYPTDVLAGWTAGTAWALLCWTLALALEKRGNGRALQR